MARMAKNVLKYLPLFLFFILHATLVMTFSLAAYLKHVTYFLPYISDSGAYPPESCIFGLILNYGAFTSFIMYVRYLQVRKIVEKHNMSPKSLRLNEFAFCLGTIACFGCTIVANFQETTLLLVHWIGALLLFISGAIYQCLQTIIYFKMYPIFGNKTQNFIRPNLAVLSTLSCAIFVPSGIISSIQFQGDDVTKWKKEDGAFGLHLVSTTAEWICASCTMLYVLCFVWDFKEVSLNEPEVFVCDNVAAPIENNK